MSIQHIYHFTICTNLHKNNNNYALTYRIILSFWRDTFFAKKIRGKEHIRGMIPHSLPIDNEKCLLFWNSSIYFEFIHANYYRKLMCIYSSFSLKHVSPPGCFNLFFLRVKFMLRHLLPQPLLSLLPFNKWERETYKYAKLLIFHCTRVLAHRTVCTHSSMWTKISPSWACKNIT